MTRYHKATYIDDVTFLKCILPDRLAKTSNEHSKRTDALHIPAKDC